MRFLLLICIFAVVAAEDAPHDLLYHVPGLGEVRGTLIKAPARGIETDVHQFTGIPFAQPPVGDLRFALPQPVQPWEPEVVNATKSSPSCVQTPFSMNDEWSFFEDSVIQEDCLYLNIWVPKREPTEAPLPVMVWLYGGGFSIGSISTKAYTSDVLAAVGHVVVVTVNYRVGAFGFAHLADPGSEGGAAIPGNLGFLDQQMGLRWVKEHIRPFGGDPNKVTIFGESAGSGSVTAQLAAPGSADLFVRAIAQSGSLRDPWGTRTSEYLTNKTLELAKNIGCEIEATDSATTLSCLRDADADAILNATVPYAMLPLDDDAFFFKGSVFHRLTSNDLSDKSIMLGNTVDEYRLFMLLMDPTRFPMDVKWNLDRDAFSEVTHQLLTIYSEGRNYHPLLIDALLWHYDNSTAFGTSWVNKFSQLGTDFFFTCGERRTVADWLRLESTHRPKELYLYLYN